MTKTQTPLDKFFAPPTPKKDFWPADLQTQIANVDPSWKLLVEDWYYNGPGREMNHRLVGERACSVSRVSISGSGAEMSYIYPDQPLRALTMTPLWNTKVVVLGDEPSAIGNISDGLAFSSALPQKYCGETRAIRDELARDLGVMDYGLSNLDHWASHGVLLLNCTLTVSSNAPKSHAGIGWEPLTDKIIDAVARSAKSKVFLLWGKVAHTKAEGIQSAGNQHLVLKAQAPNSKEKTNSFAGCGHFSKAKEFLERNGESVEWIRPNPATTLLAARIEEIHNLGKAI